MSIQELVTRETENSYKTRAERAAYRAGLSSAAALCDQKAAFVRKQNPGKRKGTASSIGEFAAGIVDSCADEIMAIYSKISVPAALLTPPATGASHE